jgi:hypothetical protein
MDQDRKRDHDMPNRASEMEQAEGSRESSEDAQGSDAERNRGDGGAPSSDNSGGITNRPLDRERCEQERLPERGQSQSES